MLNCRECNDTADCELRAGSSSEWEPFCRSCADRRHDDCREVYEHEMDNFGGAYGLPTIHERSLMPRYFEKLQALEEEVKELKGELKELKSQVDFVMTTWKAMSKN